MKRLIILTGAGMSAESGISTFRDSGGLWEGHDVMEVASPEGFKKNPQLVLDFYNQRRQNLLASEPNIGHILLAELEKNYIVDIITQNVDDLHERAGSTNVLHLHGELLKARSTQEPFKSIEWRKDINLGDKCENGHQLRPDIVWFGEMVPAMELAEEKCKEADIFVVIGTSLVVYPAAGLVNCTSHKIPKFIIDPNMPNITKDFFAIPYGASQGVAKLTEYLKIVK